MNKLLAYIRLTRLDKPIGIYLLLYPTLWALFLATSGLPDTKLLLIFILGVLIMRSAGCIINDVADRKIDGLIERTKNRPLVNKDISVNEALVLFIFLLLIALLLVSMTNTMTMLLAIPAVLLASIYPFTKRWTNMPQLVLAVAFAMSIPMAFSATNNIIISDIWWLFSASIVWTVIYDTMYAMSDREEDLQIGVKSSAILFAGFDKIIILILQLSLIALLIKVGLVFGLHSSYYWFLAPITMLMIYHQYLIKNNDKTLCFKAFLNNHYLGLLVLIAIVFSQNYLNIIRSIV